jgi:hypothetical protein
MLVQFFMLYFMLIVLVVMSFFASDSFLVVSSLSVNSLYMPLSCLAPPVSVFPALVPSSAVWVEGSADVYFPSFPSFNE